MPVTINGSTGISGVDGSAGTPALIGSDADTGLFVSAGQVSASLNGTAANVALVSGTAQNSTSGTAIDFTGIPSWVKRVTVMFDGVSTNGTSNLLIQIGDSGGIEASGYTASSVGADTGVAVSTYTTGFGIRVANAVNLVSGHLFFTARGSNVWICSGTVASSVGLVVMVAGTKTLSDTLDRIRITTVNGTDTFDAGSINILYE